MGVLNKDAIQQANDVEMKKVAVPEWGGDLYVRSMTGGDRTKFEMAVTSDNAKTAEKAKQQAKVRIIIMTACDEEGNLLFSESDVHWLSKKAAKPIERVFEAARILNGIGTEDIEELAGNSDEVQGDGSPSD